MASCEMCTFGNRCFTKVTLSLLARPDLTALTEALDVIWCKAHIENDQRAADPSRHSTSAELCRRRIERVHLWTIDRWSGPLADEFEWYRQRRRHCRLLASASK